MSAQPTSPSSSDVAADQPKDRDESLSVDAEPKSQDVNQEKSVEHKSLDKTNSAALESPKSSQSSQSQESGEASPIPSADSAAAESSAPPLPNEPPPATEDDGWDFHWDATSQAYFFHNRYTNQTTWENPRLATEASTAQSEITASSAPEPPKNEKPPAGGYNPAIHGDYDPNAWYAQTDEKKSDQDAVAVDPSAAYASMGTFNRFTGGWQAAEQTTERYNDEAKSRRQMNAFFDVDAAANSHDGRSLKAERSGKKPTKAELKQFKEKRRAKKEEKRRAWLRD
ncbi:uncharacterized protein GGS22DRAFT_108405 [Annulohypoxylon maeteangense]|uniref:uncharacterized protein n=1 Tax=Annulohypoxylon maeteangense TaxID=1927788 RepID=UPI0020073F2D|nr:uncharacterized protein GGS22DRAFT_108405 [Annulohypoxylon maeteangense]KAI0887376.1 hypothetical protein GGS22DRAFT_108405 [Annulohypoxylon maeteangense]